MHGLLGATVGARIGVLVTCQPVAADPRRAGQRVLGDGAAAAFAGQQPMRPEKMPLTMTGRSVP
jgi:hypothetical protein